jgi:hypothetical protein
VKVRLEASGFYGSESGENRWIIQTGPINSWATRLWFFPTKNWAAQVSVGRIVHPEALEPGDQVRATASLAVHQTHAGRKLGLDICVGAQPQHRHASQSEFVRC